METAATAVLRVRRQDVQEEFLRTSGRGGQRKNKVATAVRLTHNPSGVTVVADGEREQGKNRTAAWHRLEEKLSQLQREEASAKARVQKQKQFAADDYWTWTEYSDKVIAPSGVAMSYKRAMRGLLSPLLT